MDNSEIPLQLNPIALEMNRPALGATLVYGNNGKRVECFNLNTKAYCSYLFYGCKNIVLPEGLTFEGCTDASGMFYNASNIILPESVTFASLTKSSNMFQNYNGVIPDSIKFDKLTNMTSMFYNSSVNIPLEATFEKVTTVTQTFNKYKKNVILPKATFASYTGTLASLFLSYDAYNAGSKLVYMPIAKWNKNKDERTDHTYKFRYRLPAATFESMTYSTNILDSWGIHDWFIMPMVNLNLKSLKDAAGMFHWCSLDLETMRAIAYGPADLEDPNKGLKDWTGDSATHTITLGINKELEGTPEIAQILTDIRAKNWTVVEEYNEQVYFPED